GRISSRNLCDHLRDRYPARLSGLYALDLGDSFTLDFQEFRARSVQARGALCLDVVVGLRLAGARAMGRPGRSAPDYPAGLAALSPALAGQRGRQRSDLIRNLSDSH